METLFSIFKTNTDINENKDEDKDKDKDKDRMEIIIKLRNKFISKFRNIEINQIKIKYCPISSGSNYHISLDDEIVCSTDVKKMLGLIDKLNRPYIIDNDEKSGDIYIRFVYGMNLKKIE